MKIVDCLGLACPQPVLETKKALEDSGIVTYTSLAEN